MLIRLLQIIISTFNRVITFSKFAVKVLMAIGVSRRVCSLPLLPPWWQTWWMYLIYVIVFAAAIYGYNKYRSTALIKENRVLEERVLERTRGGEAAGR